MEIEEAYRQKMTAQLNEWSAQLNLIEAKARNASADQQVAHAEEIAALRATQQTAYERMRELGRSSGAAWDQVRTSADKVWDDMKAGIAAVSSKFR